MFLIIPFINVKQNKTMKKIFVLCLAAALAGTSLNAQDPNCQKKCDKKECLEKCKGKTCDKCDKKDCKKAETKE